jgi:hypothetical protein
VDVETSGIPVRMYAASHSDGFIEDALHVDEVGASSQTNVSASLN